MVAIIGRANVGKSTLFNRLARARLAIVEDLPGTTRDRLYADITWGDTSFTLVDTGGLELSPSSDLARKVKEQVEVSLAEAEVVLFLTDVTEGVTSLDQDIAQLLRRSGKPVLLVVNKVDNEERRYEALQFHALALGEPRPVSAYHNLGMDDLMRDLLVFLPPTPPAEDEAEVMKLAIVGRPNVGKSQLLNALLGQERAIVSETPGTTRDALDTPFTYEGQRMLLIDTGGLRRRGRIEAGIEQYSVYRALRAIGRSDITLLVMDATELNVAQDAHIVGYIKEAFKGIIIVVNKWDLAPKLGLEASACTQEIQQKLRFIPYAPILFTSALQGTGVKEVLAVARQIYEERQKRVPTAKLNQVVNLAVATQPPPRLGGRRLHLLYATQAAVNPPTFVFFVNDAQLVHFSYERYLENRLREAFGFLGTPLKLVFRSRREKE